LKKAPFILKNPVRTNIEDFAWLRQKGLDYISALSSEIWTDYNFHDPGITILEVLCYALTECGYRNDFDIVDLVARRMDVPSQKDFYTAREILTINPTTIPDLKKYIIDQDGIKNAWLYKAKYDDNTTQPFVDQPAFYYQCQGDTKAFNIQLAAAAGFTPKYLNGLYNVMLQLEDDDALGDLNDNVIEWDTATWSAEIVFPVVQVTFPWFDDAGIQNMLNYTTLSSVDATVSGSGGTRSVDSLVLHFSAVDTLTFNNLAIVLADTDNTNTFPDNATIIAELEDMATDQLRFGETVFRRYKTILTLIREVYCALQKTRNLCEDYVQFSLVHEQKILMCADIDVTPDADIATVLAEIYFRVENFLSPELKFYNLLEMYNKGLSTEDIFDGPVLNHGFIVNEELDACDLKECIHTSDLYNIIMDIPGVLAVKYLQLTNYLDGIALTDGELWCLKLGGPYALHLKPLSEQKIDFYKNDLLFFADTGQAALFIKALEAGNTKPKFNNTENDIPLPVGNFRNPGDYYSIQNDFPDVYKTGKNGISITDTTLRVAQVKQLKAFLLFFDQVLVNYFGQLNLAKDLLSVSASTVTSTYAALPAYDTPDTAQAPNFFHVQNLFKAFTDSIPTVTDLDNEPGYQPQWSAFIANPGNGFLTALKAIVEDNALFDTRRNQFLDHLLARFAESFGDYVIIAQELFDANSTNINVQQNELDIINDKIAFLSDYPQLSSQRGKAFRYGCCNGQKVNYWPMNNISGLQRRGARLLGIDDPTDRALVPVAIAPDVLSNGFNITFDGVNYGFEFAANGISLLDSMAPIPTTVDDCLAIISVAIERGTDITAYIINGDFTFSLQDTAGNILAVHASPPASEQDAKEIIAEIIKTMANVYWTEGFHLVEHILLRPLADINIKAADVDKGYFPVCKLTDDCDCPITDYYSFRATLVMPYWTTRFINMDFRAYAERLLQSEAPAHVLLKICWVGALDMYQFEQDYLVWLQQRCLQKPVESDLADATTVLIKKINNLTNVYLPGVLHNCGFPSSEPPIVLGRSALGTINEEAENND